MKSWGVATLILGGSWEVKSGVTRRVTLIITHIRGLTTSLVSTHVPPSTGRHKCLQGRCGADNHTGTTPPPDLRGSFVTVISTSKS